MNGQKQFGATKVIALCLLLVSFATLFFPWITISIEVKGMSFTMEELIEMGGTSKAEVLDNLRYQLEWGGQDVDVDGIIDMMEIILDGKVSVFQCATVCADLGDMMENMGAPSSASDEAEMYAIIIWVIIGAMGVTMLFAIYALVKDKMAGTVVHAALSAAVLAAAAIVIGKLNDAAGPAFMEGLEDSMGSYGGMMDISGMISTDLFHLGVAPLVCVGAAALAAILHKVHLSSVAKAAYVPVAPAYAPAYTPVAPTYTPAAPTYTPAAPTYTPAAPTYAPVAPAPVAPAPAAPAPAAGWTCTCGKVNNEANRFCNACGHARPENNKCTCGAVRVPGQVFCSMCGTKFDETPAAAAAEEPNAVCSQCGASQPKEHTFCQFCGAPMK